MSSVAQAEMMPTVLEFNTVSKHFTVAGAGHRQITALQDVNLKLSAGGVTGLIGPDGAGKTTLMRLTAGLLLPDAGDITVLGHDIRREALRVQASIGYMPQRFGLYEDLSVQENLDLYADLQGVPLEQRGSRYEQLMHMTGLGPFTRRLAGRLSGGMKQKLGLACTLVRPPRLLLLDEPTVGVDPVSRRELWEIVYSLVHDEAMTVLLSTAYLDEAERCDEVILFNAGRQLGHSAPADFSAGLSGRCYTLSVPGVRKRVLQTHLAHRPGVLDAVIQGEEVRLIMAEGAHADLSQLLSGIPLVTQTDTHIEETTPLRERARLNAVKPRFEDGFITRIRAHYDSEENSSTSSAQASRGNTATATVTKHPRSNASATTTHKNPTGSSTSVIHVSELERRFGDFLAVHGISFDVQRGEVFGLLGANGAGKTTTFRMLCGLLPPSGGQLSVAGVDLRHAAADARARIGYMSQKFSLYGHLSVEQNLRFFSGAYGLRKRHRAERIAWALEQFELADIADATSQDLSLGYKQRLALACALMHEPDILFLDEPTSGVDPLARREFWHRINGLAESGVTILVTTHFMEEAEYCDRLAIMAAGEILALGTPMSIKQAQQRAGGTLPDMEEAFIRLIEGGDTTRGKAS